jgi:diaminopimelate epimerase
MKINFEKYQGTGNDFVMIDNREGVFNHTTPGIISRICDRRFGIGSDGLILIEAHQSLDFEMLYYNPDGSKSLCGNGSRCAVMFAKSLGIIQDNARFETINGPLHAEIIGDQVHLQMPDVTGISYHASDFFINTGSPHFIQFVSNVNNVNVEKAGREIRYKAEFGPTGTNVNFVEIIGDKKIFVRTYERGVENETLSCGTGVTACALAAGRDRSSDTLEVVTKGGLLKVSFAKNEKGGFEKIYLIGPAEKVFSGMIDLD